MAMADPLFAQESAALLSLAIQMVRLWTCQAAARTSLWVRMQVNSRSEMESEHWRWSAVTSQIMLDPQWEGVSPHQRVWSD
jgi:hypothetical protein